MIWLFGIILLLTGLAWVAGNMRGHALSEHGRVDMHSRPGYHGAFAAIWTFFPAVLLLGVLSVAQPVWVNYQVEQVMPEEILTGPPLRLQAEKTAIETIARNMGVLDADDRAAIAAGEVTVRNMMRRKGVTILGNPGPYAIEAAEVWVRQNTMTLLILVLSVCVTAILGFFFAYARLRAEFRARNKVEDTVIRSLMASSVIAILTTLGIIYSLAGGSIQFFSVAPLESFFLETAWEPGFTGTAADGVSAGRFGIVPLLWGTLYISLVALIVAVPIGLASAIYLSEYASGPTRGIVKPLLEILAGIPTIVYGFFGLVTIGPLIRALGEDVGLTIAQNSILVAGIVMGMMIVPFVSSLADDIINAVPQDLRNGSLALGATDAETIKRVVMPAALPGVVGAILLAASRAIGETMIVVMIAGVTATLLLDPTEAGTTITVKIVSQLTGDYQFNSPQTLVAYALGITLFVITLMLNVVALQVVRRYREQYE